MELQIKKVGMFSPINKQVVSLRNRVFPKSERIYPMWLLKLLTLREMTTYEAFFDGDTFVGFLYDFHNDDLVFGLYLAVDPDLQSKGYGSAVLNKVHEKYGTREMVLIMEAPIEQADNYEQRVKRLRLYERMGFHFSGYVFRDPEPYWVMSTKGRDFNVKSYTRLFRKISFGFYVPKVTLEE